MGPAHSTSTARTAATTDGVDARLSLVDYDDLSIATPGATADTTAPSVPADLVARPAGSQQIDLAWTGSTDAVGVHAYRVYRGGTVLAIVGSTSWSDTGLAPSTFYAYTVSAIDGAANESPSTATGSGWAP
jgi:hypothetical protein